jgi:predicted nucleic acid-binding Zn ribbon protein
MPDRKEILDGAEGVRHLSAVLDGLFGRKGALRRPLALEDARRAWTQAAGPKVAEHTRVRSLRRGILTIEVDSPALCHRLAAFDRENLLHAVKERVTKAEVAEMRFRLGTFTGG